MVFYVMTHKDVLTYIGYSIIEGDKVTIGPNGTYAGEKKFIKDKSKGVEVKEYYIGKGETLPVECSNIVRVGYVELNTLDAEDKKVARKRIKDAGVPEVIRVYLTGLHNYTDVFHKVIPPAKFFNPTRYADPLLVGDNIFYLSNMEEPLNKGKYYLLTNPPNEIGRNASTALYGVVYLNEEIPYVKGLANKFSKNLDGHTTPVVVYRNNINSVGASMLLRDYGYDTLEFSNIDFHRSIKPILKFSSDLPLVEMIREPVLGFRAFEKLDALDLLYGKYRQGLLDKFYTVIDVTSKIWENGKLLDTYKSGKKLKVLYEKGLPIPFIPGTDIPSYNDLRKIAKYNPICKIIIEDIDKPFITYSFIIECDVGTGIYKSPFSNTIFKKALKKT